VLYLVLEADVLSCLGQSGQEVQELGCREKRDLVYENNELIARNPCGWIGACDSGSSSIVSHERFGGLLSVNGDATDASGNGNDGTVIGATLTTDRFGVPNRAYRFDGVSSMILFPETVFGPTNAAWTVSAWITTDGGPYLNNQGVFLKSSLNGGMGMGIISNQVYFGVHLAASQTSPQIYAPLLTNSVMQLVGVYQQGQSISLYVNGRLSSATGIPNDNLTVSGLPVGSALGAYARVSCRGSL
jgi:hypothetical protein